MIQKSKTLQIDRLTRSSGVVAQSVFVITVGAGLPLRQHRSLHVWCNWMTRGRSRKVNVGTESRSSCQSWYSSGLRRRSGVISGLYCGTSFGSAIEKKKKIKKKILKVCFRCFKKLLTQKQNFGNGWQLSGLNLFHKINIKNLPPDKWNVLISICQPDSRSFPNYVRTLV